MIYGFNFTHLSNLNATPTAQPGQEGVICTYHVGTNRDRAKAQLQQALQNGLKAIRIPIYMLAEEELVGLEDGFTCKLQADSHMVPQEEANLQNLLYDVEAAGFDYVEVGPGYGGSVLNPFTWTTVEPWWHRPGMFLVYLRQMMKTRTWKKWSIDLAAECIRPDIPVAIEYATTIWDFYTAGAWPDGQRCMDASISCIIDPLFMAAMPQVFQGNWPWKVGLHLYNPEPGVAWGSSHEAIVGSVVSMSLVGVPSDVEKHIDETYDFRDVTNCAGMQTAFNEHPECPFTVVQQWAVMRGQPNTSPALNGWPTQLGI